LNVELDDAKNEVSSCYRSGDAEARRKTMGRQAKTLVAGAYESAPESGDAPESQRQLTAPAWQQNIAPNALEAWPTSRRSLEVASLVVLSALLHVGVAYGFYTSEKAPPERRNTSVDIELVRPPEPKLVAPEPKEPEPLPPRPPVSEPPVPQKQASKSIVAAPAEATPAAPPAAPEPQPVDPGIEAEATEDGNLLAGKGGTGIQPPKPEPAAPVAVAPVPPPLVQAHEGANYSKNPRPAYPARAKREGWQGKVVLRVQVLPNGRAGQISVQTSAGRQQLDDAAQAAVRGWTFVPARRGGIPTSGWVNVPIEFRLQ
jgi:protein TonB